MRHLSVIGLGAMGSALATTLLKAGHPVTVWNRSAAKAAPLQALGATLAPSVGAAIAASDITLVCVDNYAVSQQLLDEASDAVAGKLLVQLSTGSPQGARALESWSHARGAGYLDGAILCFPDQIGTTDASIICSGASAAFSDAEPVLRLLAPHPRPCGRGGGRRRGARLCRRRLLCWWSARCSARRAHLRGGRVAGSQGVRPVQRALPHSRWRCGPSGQDAGERRFRSPLRQPENLERRHQPLGRSCHRRRDRQPLPALCRRSV